MESYRLTKGDDAGHGAFSTYRESEKKLLAHCTLCPRNCGANRLSGNTGYCKSDGLFRVSSVCIHRGEEPVISGEKGICNVFFPHCNLQCTYCQNFEISQNDPGNLPGAIPYTTLIRDICRVLDQSENIVGFVSPSHHLPQMLAIIRGIKESGRNPVFVYNTNGYDKAESLRLLEGVIDVYLPDFKYMDPQLAFRFSQARDYPEIASAAIREMYRQKGSTLILNDRGIAVSGMIIRHLILPGAVDQSIDTLRHIAEEVSTQVHVSLMSQYFPTQAVPCNHPLNRTVTSEEYNQVTAAFYDLGFYRGWVQDLDSTACYRPDFKDRKNPFTR